MKKGIVLLLLLSSAFANAQSLKDALFSGKLKNQNNTVIRKGDDLSTKMDTAQKAPAADVTTTTATTDSIQQQQTTTTDAAVATLEASSATLDSTTVTATEPAAAPKTNNAIWKTYMDSVASSLKSEALSSKKVKRGDYFVLVTYTIGTDGQTAVSDVSVSPENEYLQQQIKVRLDVDTPRLAPVVNSAGTARKSVKKYSFTLSKE